MIIRTAVPSTTSATFAVYFSCVHCVCYVLSCVLSCPSRVRCVGWTMVGWLYRRGFSWWLLLHRSVVLIDRKACSRASQRGTPLRNRYFTTIGSSSVKTVADRHRLAAYHNKLC